MVLAGRHILQSDGVGTSEQQTVQNVMKRLLGNTLAISWLIASLAACQVVAPAAEDPASGGLRDPRAITCEEWLTITEERRLQVAGWLVGDSADLLERIRVAQRLPEGSGRNVLIQSVAGSLTKNCEVWPPRDRPVGDLMDRLYGRP